MRFIDKINIKVHEINQDFELGDLTIIIGRSNCGKSRILKDIEQRINNASSKVLQNGWPYNSQGFLKSYQDYSIILTPQAEKAISCTTLQSYRQPKGNMNGLATSIAKCAESLRKIDPTINDLGNTEIEKKNGERRTLGEQGSGTHNMTQIFEALNTKTDVVLIDEPEVSQFPYGKIEILKAILEQTKQKQIIVATHDPTLINQHLIRKINESKEKNKDRNMNIIIYSFCGKKFEKVDLSICDPEIHVGYLSQTYSGKPVHLIVEGQTEFYAFQALLFKYAQFLKVPYYPKFINKISISYVAGGQWEINKHHFPDPKYYDVLFVLDGEYKNDIKNAESDIEFKKIAAMSDCEDGYVNWLCLDAKKIETAFKDIFDKVSEDKPIGLSIQVWGIKNEEINKVLNGNDNALQILSIVEWCLKKAGAIFEPKVELAKLMNKLK